MTQSPTSSVNSSSAIAESGSSSSTPMVSNAALTTISPSSALKTSDGEESKHDSLIHKVDGQAVSAQITANHDGLNAVVESNDKQAEIDKKLSGETEKNASISLKAVGAGLSIAGLAVAATLGWTGVGAVVGGIIAVAGVLVTGADAAFDKGAANAEKISDEVSVGKKAGLSSLIQKDSVNIIAGAQQAKQAQDSKVSSAAHSTMEMSGQSGGSSGPTA